MFALRARRPLPLAPFAVADTLLLVLILLGEGGAPADMRFALSVPVLVAAFVAGPRLTSQLALLSLAGFVARRGAQPDLRARGARALRRRPHLRPRVARRAGRRPVAVPRAALGADPRAGREPAVAHGPGPRGRGARPARARLRPPRRARAGPAERAAGHQAARRGHAEYLDRAEDGLAGAVAQLRTQILHLHPHQLESAGLGAALDAVSAGLSLADGSHPVVAVTSAATAADPDTEVLFAVGRELLTNAVRHAGAERRPVGRRRRPARRDLLHRRRAAA